MRQITYLMRIGFIVNTIKFTINAVLRFLLSLAKVIIENPEKAAMTIRASKFANYT